MYFMAFIRFLANQTKAFVEVNTIPKTKKVNNNSSSIFTDLKFDKTVDIVDCLVLVLKAVWHTF